MIDGGEVDDLVTSADPIIAEVIFLPTIVSEFPVNWCIRSDAFEVSPVLTLQAFLSCQCSIMSYFQTFAGLELLHLTPLSQSKYLGTP